MNSSEFVGILPLKKPVVLIGMMGCGKSTVGRALSSNLDCPFYDCDDLIVKDQGKEITEIFSENGEAYFRDLEMKKIRELLNMGAGVISTGGGAVTVPKALEIIKSDGISIWLRSDIDKILSRLGDDTSRPLLQCDNPRKKLEELLSVRERLYALADIHVDNISDDIHETVKIIIQELKSKDADQNS